MNGTPKDPEETIERCIQDMLSDKRTEIEKSLAEVIEQERERARQRIAELEQQFQRKKEEIRAHQTMLEEVRAAASGVRDRVAKHLEQAGHCRTMVRRLTEQIGQECRTAAELREEISGLLRKADEETARVRKDLETRYGIAVPFPDLAAEGEIGPDLANELEDLACYQERLAALDAGATAPVAGPKPPAEPCPSFIETEEMAAPGPAPAPEPASAPEPAPAQEPAPDRGPDAEEISRLLESSLESEPVPDAGPFRVFRAHGHAVLDAGSILDEMARCVEDARAIHVRLAGTKSAKDQYFLKRDILSRQESLRRTLARAVEICGQGDCEPPFAAGDVLDEAVLKDLQDRLSLGNWSDAHDLATFEERLESLRTALTALMADKRAFDRAILEQLNQAV